MSTIPVTTMAQYEELIKKEKVLIDIFAEWCGPCRQLKKLLDESEFDFPIYTLDADVLPSVPANFGIRSIPALLLFKDGKLLDTKVGLTSVESIIAWYNSFN